MDLQILGSSSKGNCALLKSGSTQILLDAGFSGKKIKTFLNFLGSSLEQIQGIILTHEHSDHCIGLSGLIRKTKLPVYANTNTAEAIQKKEKITLQWQIFENQQAFQLGDISITSLPIPHDAIDPVGFLFETKETNSFSTCAWITDLGYIPPSLRKRIQEVDLLVIESNYDEELLRINTTRPLYIKDRIRSDQGHLSNTATFQFLQETDTPGWKKVILAHLSKECNCTKRIQKQFSGLTSRLYEMGVLDPLLGTLISF